MSQRILKSIGGVIALAVLLSGHAAADESPAGTVAALPGTTPASRDATQADAFAAAKPAPAIMAPSTLPAAAVDSAAVNSAVAPSSPAAATASTPSITPSVPTTAATTSTTAPGTAAGTAPSDISKRIPAAVQVAEATPSVRSNPLGAKAIDLKLLDKRRGAGDIASEMQLKGVVSDNRAVNVTTGSNLISDSAFANAVGMPMVVQNTGNNVLIQNATIVNVVVK